MNKNIVIWIFGEILNFNLSLSEQHRQAFLMLHDLLTKLEVSSARVYVKNVFH